MVTSVAVWRFRCRFGWISINCKTFFDAEDATIPEELFFGKKFSGIDEDVSNPGEEILRDELLQCHICGTGDNIDPNHPCFVNQTAENAVECPDLTFTSCYTTESVAEMEGEIFYFMARGCSKDPVQVVTGINDTGETEYGRIVGMDATYTGYL